MPQISGRGKKTTSAMARWHWLEGRHWKYLLLFLIIEILSYILIIFYYFQQYRDIGWFNEDTEKFKITLKLEVSSFMDSLFFFRIFFTKNSQAF